MAETAVERVARAYARLREADRPEAWITLRPEAEVAAEAAIVDDRVGSGTHLPLAGRLVAVKDNIDVAGLPTTAACPAYAYTPTATAPAVARLLGAGALVLGKTNMDQFATGLVGTRSPYGTVRNVRSPELIAGGSSSGSAVAVALEIADIGLGTDTAGSGRVPAALQGVAAVKPTRGVVPIAGVVPASPSYDCVAAFARDLGEAETAVACMSQAGQSGPRARCWPASAPVGAPPSPVVAVPFPADLTALPASWRASFGAGLEALVARGARLTPIDLGAFWEGSDMLYHSSIRAERYAAVGAFIDAHRDGVDPAVGAVIAGARTALAHQLADDLTRLAGIRSRAEAALDSCDVLLLPTTIEHPAIADVAADPLGVNDRLGRLTCFCNLFDMSAASVPLDLPDGLPFGVTVYARGFADRVAIDVGRLLSGGDAASQRVGRGGVRLLAQAAHADGGPFNDMLAGGGGRRLGTASTAPGYRLAQADGRPSREGLLHGDEAGGQVAGELWELPAAALAAVVGSLSPPLALGPVRLADGSSAAAVLYARGVGSPVAADR